MDEDDYQTTPSKHLDRETLEGKRRHTAPSYLEHETASQQTMQGFAGGGDSHLERELAKRFASPDERLGAAASAELNSTFKGLARDLGRLANISGDLGSSIGIVKSSTELRDRVIRIRLLLRTNASDLFPKTVKRPTAASSYFSKTSKSPAAQHNGSGLYQKLDLEELPGQFKLLVNDIKFFISCLRDFPDFTDESLYDALSDFEDEAIYVSYLLSRHKGRFGDIAIKKYTQDLLTGRLGEPMEDVVASLVNFIDTGIQAIRSTQDQDATTSLTLTSLATFFSAVSATTLQYSFPNATTVLQVTVNTFWFCSLVFSIASVVNGLLAYMWKNAKYRSPEKYTPSWVLVWMNKIPLIALIISAAAFSIGLCAFAYSSHQNIVTSVLTTIFTVISSAGLVVVMLWFSFENWAYGNYDGTRWPLDVIPRSFRENAIVSLFFRTPPSSEIRQSTSKEANKEDLIEEEQFNFDFGCSESDSKSRHIFGTQEHVPDHAVAIDIEKASDAVRRLAPKELFYGLVALKVLLSRNRRIVKHRMQRVGRSLLMLSGMKPTRTLHSHETLVRHMQFSPNGRSLATCSWDGKVYIYEVKDLSSPPLTLDFSKEQDLLSHLAWSPKGNRLICKMLRGLSIWTHGGEAKTINRERSIESVTWFPTQSSAEHHQPDAFLSVEGSVVRKMNIYGEIEDEYVFEDITIHDAAVTPDSSRMICVATRTPHSESSICTSPPEVGNICAPIPVDRNEEMILLYNFDKKKTESCVPVVGESRNVKLAKNGALALVSYENQTPPQIWKISMTKNHSDGEDSDKVGHLLLEQTLLPKKVVDFAGPSHFGGEQDDLVICAGKDGTMYVWDSKTGFLLHEFDMGRFRAGRRMVDELTSLTWNHVSDTFMFCTGHVSGTVNVWTSKQNPITDTGPVRRGRKK
ncbi:WD40 repeat-like protein [Schizopora paradoxa]|uniref:WD40 repeat-like protein n=1 Tax=Schizopora paradoxa TaxID=27342 RepID=A0A0H2S5W9_9AGAM|nr:WD40 repeat-like protein [Schizopora paradoxa]